MTRLADKNATTIPLDIAAIAASAIPITPDPTMMPSNVAPEMSRSPTDNTGLHIDQSTIARLKHLQQQRNTPNLMLRVRILGGGCSGFQYKFELITQVNDNDLKCGTQDAMIIVDPLSMRMLQGATLRFVSTPIESSFQLENPQAKSQCGCGVSFDLR